MSTVLQISPSIPNIIRQWVNLYSDQKCNHVPGTIELNFTAATSTNADGNLPSVSIIDKDSNTKDTWNSKGMNELAKGEWSSTGPMPFKDGDRIRFQVFKSDGLNSCTHCDQLWSQSRLLWFSLGNH